MAVRFGELSPLNKVITVSMLLSSISVFSLFFNIFVQFRFETMLLMLRRKILLDRDLWSLVLVSICPIFFSLVSSEGIESTLMYLPLTLSYLYIILYMGSTQRQHFFLEGFFPFALIVNSIYIVFQTLVHYSGFPELAMVHSTIPGQVDYLIPQDMFFRYSGLFNENGPLVFFLMLCFVYLQWAGNKLSWLAFALIAMSGSKLGVLFIVVWFSYKLGSLFLFVACFTLATTFFLNGISVFHDLEKMLSLAPSTTRFEVFSGSLDNIGFLPGGFAERGWDVFSYHLRAYGLGFGIGLILLHVLIIRKSQIKSELFIVFFLALLSHGSLAAVNHSFLLLVALLTKVSSRTAKPKHDLSWDFRTKVI